MNKPNRILQLHVTLFAILITTILSDIRCGHPHTVSPLLYLLIPDLKAGGTRPTTPQNLSVKYDLTLPGIRLHWEPSTDPDTQKATPFYKVYLYLDGPPEIYYEEKNLYDIAVLNEYVIPAAPPVTNLYFVVTGFDGFAESLPSNTAIIRPL